MTTGAFANGAASWIINEITGDDTTFGDLCVSFMAGGVGGGVSMSGPGAVGALGFFLGSAPVLGQSINDH